MDASIGDDVQHRLMRVKVLYTFGDENKSNCLARLPNALNIPAVSLDETTEVGIIELKFCIQAIVAASPELVARLGHDYTVYAYDYSEYETPLVGQGMLSWILASASPTPNAPAESSQTMVTGRICKNILGLFSNGVKETLEVKLKLVPVPTRHQREYVENMERYHNLSRVMPEGLDYHEWADFLKSNPAMSQLAQPIPSRPPQGMICGDFGNMGPGHQMQSQPPPQPEQPHCDYSQMSYTPYGTRPSSPAMSTISFSHYPFNNDGRPTSQASMRSMRGGPMDQGRTDQHNPQGTEQQEEGPPKKRARVIKASRPRKTPLGAPSESLRVTAATAASVRLHRPANSNSAADVAAMHQVPRAPTPRPRGRSASQLRAFQHVSAPSRLRHAPLDESRSPASNYETAMFSDNAVDSADDERGNSPGGGETPMDIPSSPPLLPHGLVSSAPSSPGLPALPYAPDSGFVSDMPLGAADSELGPRARAWEGSDLPTAAETRTRRRPDRSHHPWTEVNPGPVELLPKSYIPKPKQYARPKQTNERNDGAIGNSATTSAAQPNSMAEPTQTPQNGQPADEVPPSAPFEPSHAQSDLPNLEAPAYNQQNVASQHGEAQPDSVSTPAPDTAADVAVNAARATTPNGTSKPARSSKSRDLPRSQTWSAEPMSDAATEGGARQPRSGSGAKRKQNIVARLHKSLAEGVMPEYCNHCGEIETPTWRKAYMRVEEGLPTNIQLSSEGTSIVGYEIIEPVEGDDGTPKYRIFKQVLEKHEKEAGSFVQLNLCNPCGLWLVKKNAMRPRELWIKKSAAEKGKRKRNPPKSRKRSKGPGDDLQSETNVPHSEPVMRGGEADMKPFSDAMINGYDQQIGRYRSCSSQLSGPVDMLQHDDTSIMDALHRAIQSSPGGIGFNRQSPVNLEPQLTPKPTRRMLFPSPRRAGEFKSLGGGLSVSPSRRSPRSKSNNLLDQLPDLPSLDTDKENCRPDDDDLAHLFDEQVSAKYTPSKNTFTLEAPKTPSSSARRRNALGEKRNADLNTLTPSRTALTPSRGGRAATLGPETPLTRKLNALLGSPSGALDFSTFPDLLLTPGGSLPQLPEYNFDDLLSSDMPLTSSPSAGFPNFTVFEDPVTSSVGLWSGTSIFEGSDALTGDVQQGSGEESGAKATIVAVDLTAMIDGVVGDGGGEGEQSTERPSTATEAVEAAL